jgi:hypothetical protein
MILEIEAMSLFLGTLIIVCFCCLLLGIGVIMAGKPLAGGCGGKAPASSRCVVCPRRTSRRCKGNHPRGEP